MLELFNTFETKDWISLGAAVISVFSIGVNIYLNRTQYRKNINIENQKHIRDKFYEFYKLIFSGDTFGKEVHFYWKDSSPPETIMTPNFKEAKLLAAIYLRDFEPLIENIVSKGTALQEKVKLINKDYFKRRGEIADKADPNNPSTYNYREEDYIDLFNKHQPRIIEEVKQYNEELNKFYSIINNSIGKYNKVSTKL
ncbi:hypothetical protein MAH1_33690 [Sessilibacter sp. MAH1]